MLTYKQQLRRGSSPPLRFMNNNIEQLIQFLRDFALANADSFEPEQIQQLNSSADALANLDKAVDELVVDRDWFESEVDRITDERDEARVDYCRQQAAIVKGMATPEQVANNLNWDCFKQEDGK